MTGWAREVLERANMEVDVLDLSLRGDCHLQELLAVVGRLVQPAAALLNIGSTTHTALLCEVPQLQQLGITIDSDEAAGELQRVLGALPRLQRLTLSDHRPPFGQLLTEPLCCDGLEQLPLLDRLDCDRSLPASARSMRDTSLAGSS